MFATFVDIVKSITHQRLHQITSFKDERSGIAVLQITDQILRELHLLSGLEMFIKATSKSFWSSLLFQVNENQTFKRVNESGRGALGRMLHDR